MSTWSIVAGRSGKVPKLWGVPAGTYFHFDGRVDLLVQLSREIDSTIRGPDRQARIDDAPDGATALEAVALQGYTKPRISGVASAVDRLQRGGDIAAKAAWEEREQSRLRRCRALAKRLSDEGKLAPSWTEPDAARMIWAATSQRAWHELVVDGGWSTKRWVERTTSLLLDSLVV